ncbi:MAG: ABC transporter permease subunit, partial [Lachnospiraceae bacterium]|nr:ABC transporter permease subunit [Lachnospiraceae bacterium]
MHTVLKSASVRKKLKKIIACRELYLMLLIPVVITIIYKYIPMYGIQIAFRDFKAGRGFSGSEWVGLDWFKRFFSIPTFWRMIKNTVLLNVYSILWSFPVPIIIALIVNQLRFKRYKRTVQTILYAPHFISSMVVCGMIKIFLSPYGGLVNLLFGTSVDFMTEASAFRTIYIASGIWQEAGWGTIIYIATLSTVDPALYESAKVDGASVFKRILHIDLPQLLP